MDNQISDIKKSMEQKLEALRLKRKQLIANFKKQLEEQKILKLKDFILNKKAK